ncbi:radical SAM protein [Aquabacterium sp. A7-Y]|uniref:B12-binding domain-containing radical SAM protein n=1 Tax=Aquabacterium sp. A7-Y TaxID=1349605 RepID=UPI00223E0DCB|nr:radical SAM protein [Aquabacterium sp. A7-Y]MCW7538789.1 radical SAM protein [Aquabacterium sp. A7-Y]
MRVAIIAVFTDYHRRGAHHRGAMQPQIGPLIAALLPDWCEVDIVNDTWEDPDWSRSYDLVLLSCLHPDFDRARQIAHYYRRRGALTVLGGAMASDYPHLCLPYFDAVVVGEPEDTVPRLLADARRGRLAPVYRSQGVTPEDVPAWRGTALAHKQPFPLAVEASRGCPYSCDFCVLPARGESHRPRPVAAVVREILAAREALRLAGVSGWKQRMLVLYDNNLAGNLKWFRELCHALGRLDLHWGACLTFNVIANRELLKLMYASGCRSVYVGLETFNPAALAGMCKPQNNISRIQQAIAQSRDEGILVMAGLMVSAIHDDARYIRSLPERLRSSGLHVPSFISFETPIPGTHLFQRLASDAKALFLPHANLCDFSSYTLVLRPQQSPLHDFLAAYRESMKQVYSPGRKLAKLADDLPRLLARGSWTAAALDVVDMGTSGGRPVRGRTFMAGTDPLPPEKVPFAADDFSSEAEQLDICSPTPVTDEDGRVLDAWLPQAHRPVALKRPQPARAMTGS